MKRTAFIVLICLLSQTVSAQEFNLSWIDLDAQGKAASARKTEAIRNKNGAVGKPGIDIKFHRLLLTLDPAIRKVTGSVTTWFQPVAPSLASVTFDLQDSMHVSAIRYHGDLITGFTHANNKIIIPVPTLQPGVLDSIMIDYQGIPNDDGLGTFTLDKHAGVPILYTLSEPYGARDWWPCSQDLNDKIDSILLVITVPPGNRAAANGMLISEQHLADRSIYQWKHKHPVAAYLIGVSVTNYAVYSDYVPLSTGGSIEILNYVYPESLAEIRTQTPAIIKPFQLYNEWFGLYPFADERYGHAQWNWGGGMEHQTMSFMGSFGYDLMAHELGHQWFGDYLTCGSWRDIWLNEGFATYMTGLCYEHDQGGIYWEPFKRLSINRVMKEPGGSVYCYDTTSVDRIFDARLSYSKGGLVLHMLRWEMGDENFFKALNNYLHDPALANGYATTRDLIRHAEAVADTSFQEFFNDWVYGAGYPTYRIVYRQNPDQAVELVVSQESSDPSVDFFEMDLPMVLYGKGIAATEAKTMVMKHTYNGQVFRFNPGYTVDSVKLDPERWICTANPVILNVSEIPYDQLIRIYPNPVTDWLTIDMTVPEEGRTVKIYNLKGQLVFHGKSSFIAPRMQVSMQGFARGVYTVEVEGMKPVRVVRE